MTRESTGAVRIRALRDGDAAGVCGLIADLAAEDASYEPMRVDEWRDFVGQSWNLGGKDFRVAEQGGRLVAVMMSTRQPSDGRDLRSFRIIVRTEARRQGIGSRLFADLEAQDADAVTQHADNLSSWRDGERFLRRRGFGAVRKSLWMSCAIAPQHVAPPEGVTLRADRGDDADDVAWRTLSDLGYRGTASHVALTPDDMAKMRRAAGFHLWFAEAGGRVVGLCHTKEFGGKACINSLVVHPDHRSRGLARALLVAGMRTARDAMGPPVRLDVYAGNEHALALYRSVGFETDETITTWWREKAPTPP